MERPQSDVPAKKSTFLLLTLLLGGIGAHRAYVGKRKQAVLFTLLSITLIPGLIALFDFFRHVVKDRAAFAQLYPSTISRRALVAFVAAAVAFECLVGTAVWAYLVMHADRGGRVQSGLIRAQDVTAELARRITDEFLTDGPSDMRCDPSQPATCRFATMTECRSIACMAPLHNDELQRGVIEDQFQADWYPVADSIAIDRTGIIMITFASEFLGPYFSRIGRQLVLVPQLGDVEADLSDPSNAGRHDLTWQCARDSRTSLSPRLLDRFCPHFSTLATYK